MKRIGLILILALAFSGIADSTYLAQHETTGAPLVCNIQGLTGCNIVADSQYSRLFGVSVAGIGVAFYALVFLIAALELVVSRRELRRAIQWLSLVGTIASVYFVSLQIFVLHAYCIYCIASAIIEAIILVIAAFIEPPAPAKRDVVPLPVRLTMPPVA